MKRAVSGIFIFLIISVGVFAQTAPEAILSAADVDAFIKNYGKIQSELEKMEGKYDDVFSSVEFDNPAKTLEQIRSIKIPAEIDQVFSKYGMGDRGFVKMYIITVAAAALYLEDMIKEMQAEGGDTPGFAEVAQGLMATVDSIKISINKNDLSLVYEDKETILDLMETE